MSERQGGTISSSLSLHVLSPSAWLLDGKQVTYLYNYYFHGPFLLVVGWSERARSQARGVKYTRFALLLVALKDDIFVCEFHRIAARIKDVSIVKPIQRILSSAAKKSVLSFAASNGVVSSVTIEDVFALISSKNILL